MTLFIGANDTGPLKVGSCSFKCFLILLIYFLNYRKTHFKRKEVSFGKKYRFQSIRVAVLRGMP